MVAVRSLFEVCKHFLRTSESLLLVCSIYYKGQGYLQHPSLLSEIAGKTVQLVCQYLTIFSIKEHKANKLVVYM